MDKILERVRRLIRLAASAPENEARSAAVEACRLIETHKLSIQEPSAICEAGARQEASSRAEEIRRQVENGASVVGKAIRDVATEAASRVTVKDVVDAFVKTKR